jgi:hypothetical protein
MSARWFVLVCAIVPFALRGYCQTHAKSAQPSNVVATVRTEREPRIDGNLDDPQWATAATIDDFRQREPLEKQPATEKTVVKILYDKRYLYFGIECLDAHPRNIVATELRRDGDYTVDDYFTILISPNNDRRNGYTFTVNPLGTQFDSLVADEGAVDDPNWDGVWRSASKITSQGWTATVAIPFSTLNFKTSNDVTLGVNFRRFIRHKNEEDLWQSYLRIYGIDRVSEAGELTGLEQIGSGRLLILKPYVLGGIESNHANGIHGLHTVGFDMKYGLRSDLVLNLTLNTDFAEADVDQFQFNLTPFKIFIPEKRPFFLENGGFFQFGTAGETQLFFSRQIGIDPTTGEQVPLDVGAKVTGSLGKYEVGLLDAKTREVGANPFANYLIARIKRSILADSYIGAIVTDKQSGDARDTYNRSFGFDTNLRFFKKLNIQGYAAKTLSFAPQFAGKNWTHSIEGTYQDNLFVLDLRRTSVQPHFNPEAGFAARTDVVTNLIGTELHPHPKKGPVRQWYFIGFYQRQPDTRGVLQTQEWQATIIASFQNGSLTNNDLAHSFIQRLSRPFNIFGNVVIPAGEYHFDRHQFSYSSDPSKRIYYSTKETFGTYYNGNLNEVALTANYRPIPRIALAGAETWDRFHFPQGVSNVHVGSASVSFSPSRFLTTSVLAQVNSVQTDPFSANVRVRYNYRPDSDVFVIYTLGSQFNSVAAGNPVLSRTSRFTVKFTYSWAR